MPANPIWLNLTDYGGQFQNQLFIAATEMQREMLAIALAAISTGRRVTADVNGDPREWETHQPVCSELDIVS
jgi:hypothetical protein